MLAASFVTIGTIVGAAMANAGPIGSAFAIWLGFVAASASVIYRT